MRALALSAAFACCAAPALALSCLAPDPERSFRNAQGAEASFIVVHGVFDFDPGQLPRADGPERPEGVAIAAQFAGKGLTRDGFTTALSIPVTLNVQCLGPWCGGIAQGIAHLAFLERRDDGYHLAVSACPQDAFANPDPATLDAMTACLNGGGC